MLELDEDSGSSERSLTPCSEISDRFRMLELDAGDSSSRSASSPRYTRFSMLEIDGYYFSKMKYPKSRV